MAPAGGSPGGAGVRPRPPGWGVAAWTWPLCHPPLARSSSAFWRCPSCPRKRGPALGLERPCVMLCPCLTYPGFPRSCRGRDRIILSSLRSARQVLALAWVRPPKESSRVERCEQGVGLRHSLRQGVTEPQYGGAGDSSGLLPPAGCTAWVLCQPDLGGPTFLPAFPSPARASKEKMG